MPLRSEAAYQNQLVRKLETIFPSSLVLKNNPDYIQGIPDILILFGNRWGMLEVKRSSREPIQPNQDYYVRLLNDMSFAAFICPENEEEVLNDLQSALCS